MKKVNTDFFKTWSPEMAYVLGFFMADGSITKTSRGGYYLDFHCTEGRLLETIRQVMESDHTISHRKKTLGHKQLYRLQVGSKEMCFDLKQLGITERKTHNLVMPPHPPQYSGDIIRGYFDGDGGIEFKKYFKKDRGYKDWVFTTRFTCGYKPFLIELRALLQKNGVMGGCVYSKKGGHELTLSRRDSLALFHIMYNNGHCSIKLDRKYNVFLEAFHALDFDYTPKQR